MKESKYNALIKKYELFKMKTNEKVEVVFSRFQTLVFETKVLIKKTITYLIMSKKSLEVLQRDYHQR